MKTTILALTGMALGFAILSGPALAQVAKPPPPVAVAAVIPGGPPPGTPGGKGPDGTPVGGPKVKTYEKCGWQLGKLRDVRVAQVKSVNDPSKVKVIPVCQYTSLVGDQRTNNFLSDGNVEGLTSTIGRNVALKATLVDERYDENDVVGIVIVPGNGAILYVHKRS
ncbi:hypothetical protein GCM10011321_19110 [Youhaiella tibetensis]|uniref:Uncharacterized protein n=1 Tax=Paradevosia tibetensis TaxID=1447062 RepID=A0A5B9DLW0_9HYPH|nr:hypothetical protein [Youhaiella tibetensis]AKR54905.1 hypothetical protein XM25_03615 [Devosia sp. H5989]QEE20016.1 hypothetical protein FNA67_07445 [Youhaiella tibetensis]GGF27847.1 hypothetical protein GCM10011321_19110 [Youhaiella tibetensis]